jgi:hypothetical protein
MNTDQEKECRLQKCEADIKEISDSLMILEKENPSDKEADHED